MKYMLVVILSMYSPPLNIPMPSGQVCVLAKQEHKLVYPKADITCVKLDKNLR